VKEVAGPSTESLVGAALPSLLRKNQLRDQTPVGQGALKIVLSQREVAAFYYRLPSSVSKPSCGEIGRAEDRTYCKIVIIWAIVGT
jgi:hypothetical protein